MKQSALFIALLPLLITPAIYADTTQTSVLDNRAAKGDITQPGGARRLSEDQTAAIRASLNEKPAKNIILLIGDGMGDSEITAARNYAEGAGGFFKGIDALPLTGQYTHYALDKKTGKPDYVTDSAASATAWSTGVKTYNGALGVDIHEKDRQTLLEMAKAAGLATGNVSTAELQDATPAALVAHVTSRKCYGPSVTSEKCPTNALEKGGKGSITEQLLNARPDVTLGGGAKTFAETATAGEWQGKTLREQAQARGYQLVSDANSLAAITEANQDKPLLGLFSDGNMPVRWEGPKASYHGNIDKPAVTCTPNPKRTDSVPTLAAMTDKAIDLLSKSEKGFFLQVEGASIDKQDHAANPCGQIGETVDLDEAVQKALAFAKKDGNTLVIVTADHAHASQIVPPDTKAPGLTQALNTKDGAVMVMSYGNSEEESMEHTGTQLRIAASGPGAQRVIGLTDQTDNFYTIAGALGLATTTDQQKALSDNAEVRVATENGSYAADATGFNGDAVLSYELKDKSGNVIAASDSTTPLSGVRVKTAQTTAIALDKVAEGNEYTLTVTGRQSGKSVTVDFQAPAAGSSDKNADKNADKNGVIASGKVNNNPQADGSPLGETGTAVAVVAIAVAMLAAIAMIIKTVKITR